jgi:CheY-like chemotaxis protein
LVDAGSVTAPSAMKPLHLLVTDDDLDKRTLLSRALSREFPKASIFECHSGQEALEYCASNRVDAVITNHNMYPVNGIELVTTLRRCGSGIPIIMVSGHPEIRKEAEAAGVDLFIDWNEPLKIGKPIAEFLRRRGLVDRAEP